MYRCNGLWILRIWGLFSDVEIETHKGLTKETSSWILVRVILGAKSLEFGSHDDLTDTLPGNLCVGILRHSCHLGAGAEGNLLGIGHTVGAFSTNVHELAEIVLSSFLLVAEVPPVARNLANATLNVVVVKGNHDAICKVLGPACATVLSNALRVLGVGVLPGSRLAEGVAQSVPVHAVTDFMGHDLLAHVSYHEDITSAPSNATASESSEGGSGNKVSARKDKYTLQHSQIGFAYRTKERAATGISPRVSII